LKIRLDALNPRVDTTEQSTQEDIRLHLLESEKIVELAGGIISAKGLLKGERIIVIKERGNYVVTEGNRRVCACQLLLNRKLVPMAWASTFPEIPKSEFGAIKDSISRIQADIAPDRDAAEITITKRHTEPGVKRWTPMAKQRRIIRLLNSGYSVDRIIADTGATRSAINKALQDHELLQYARNLKRWTQDELKELILQQ
jgi:hypothetical protein